jgi:sulfatase maturation enzyme AslB (radical SAM superfamily)
MKKFTDTLRFLLCLSRNGFRYNTTMVDAFFDRFLGSHKIINWKKGNPVYSSMVPPMFSPASARLFGNSLFDAFFQKTTLYEVNIALGDVCNAKCPHCSFYESIYSAESKVLDTAQYVEAVREIQSLGATNIVFVGGEPLMYDGICEVIRSIDRTKSISTVFTNGFFLEDQAKALHEAGLDTIAVSIDHHNLKIHDLKRGVAGLSEKIKK